MPRTSKSSSKTSRMKRFFAWFRCHKFSAGFAGLVVVLALYLLVSWIVLQVQIHIERNRFNSAAALMSMLGPELGGNVTYLNECTHTNFGGIFEKDSIGCSSDTKVTYKEVMPGTTKKYAQKIIATLTQQGVGFTKNIYHPSSIEADDFYYHSLTCFLDAEASFIQIDCGGPAKQNYFPSQ